MLIDSHCHLNELKDIPSAIERAKKENVGKIFSCAVDSKSTEQHIEMKQKYDGIEIALGLHPSNTVFNMTKDEIESCLELIEEKIPAALAVGEIGLDFKHAETNAKRKAQRQVLKRQLLTALEFKKPVVIHSRRAHWECFRILEDYSPKQVLMHWFYDKGSMKKIIDNNYFVSIGPSVFKDRAVQDFAQKLPIENLLLETDSPVRFNGRPAEPAWIKKVAEKVCELKETGMKTLEKECENNFYRFSGQKK